MSCPDRWRSNNESNNERFKRKESIHRVDHENTVKRRSIAIKRRTYTVPHPNAMWHCDSHHKLIRWRFITHAAIDGFSRLVVYIIIIRNSVIQKQCYRLLRTVFQDLASPVMYVLITGEKTRGRKHQGVGVHAYMLTAHNNELFTTMMSLLGHNERIEREVSEACFLQFFVKLERLEETVNQRNKHIKDLKSKLTRRE